MLNSSENFKHLFERNTRRGEMLMTQQAALLLCVLLSFKQSATDFAYSNCSSNFQAVGDDVVTFCVRYTTNHPLQYCQATAYCLENNGMLLGSIDKLVSLMKHKTSDIKGRSFYVGLHKTNLSENTIKWTLDNETFEINPNLTSLPTPDCVVMTVSSSDPAVFDFRLANCTEKHDVICERATRIVGGQSRLDKDGETDFYPRSNILCTKTVEIGVSQPDTACAISCYRESWCSSLFYRKAKSKNECVLSSELGARPTGKFTDWKYLHVEVSMSHE